MSVRRATHAAPQPGVGGVVGRDVLEVAGGGIETEAAGRIDVTQPHRSACP